MFKKGIPGILTVFMALTMIFTMVSCGDEPGKDDVTVTDVTITVDAESVRPGKTLQFSATVNGANNPPQTVTWKVTGGKTETSIDTTGKLTVGSSETDNTELTVIATSTYDESKSGTKTVTVSTSAPLPGDITYTITEVGGENNVTDSTAIKFTFISAVELEATDIALTPSEVATVGTLTGSGTEYSLTITVVDAGQVFVVITKEGIEAGSKTVVLHKAGQATPEYWNITWVFGDDEMVIDKGTASYPSEILKGEVLDKPTPDPTCEGRVFEGWYIDEDTAYDFTTAVTGDLVLSAAWEQEEEPSLPPEGINGFPETLTMGVPFDLRKNITINLPDAPDKTFDDIIWASNTSGNEFPSTQIVIEDDLFIPVTFFTRKVTVYAIVTDGEGEGFDYTETFETNIVFPLNPFIGSWSGSDGKTWTFKTDGTYGIDTVANAGSFAVWSGKPGRKFLVTVSGDPDTITVEEVGDPENGLYQPYCFEQTGDTITITPIEFDYDAVNKQDARAFDETGTPITLTRQSGEPAAFDLSKNYSSLLMIGGWSGNFAANPFNPASDTITIGNSPGITYYADGRVQQNYEGAWLKRGAVFVTVGNDGRRWDPPALASWDTVTATAMEGKQVVRIHEYRPDGAGKPYSRATNTSLCWRLVKFPSSAQPSDPAPLVNPFTGVWKTDDNEYWQFNSDGTGGKADSENGTFPDEFSFLVFAGADVQATPSEGSLVMLDDSDDDSVSVTRYTFSIVTENATTTATLTATGTPATTITLEQVSGEPAVLDLTNQFVGEWYAAWPSGAIWSIKYRADGTVRTFHHQANHQFDNAYAVRGDTLVIFGQMRFASAPIAAEITQVGNTWRATEKSTAATKWTYTKVDAAQWKEE